MHDKISADQFETNCVMDSEKSQIFTQQTSTTKKIKTIKQSNQRDVVVVIDNTILPKGGSFAQDNIVMEYSVSSKFVMPYNLRNVSIIMGIISMIVIFAIGSLFYLSFKIKGDIASQESSTNMMRKKRRKTRKVKKTKNELVH